MQPIANKRSRKDSAAIQEDTTVAGNKKYAAEGCQLLHHTDDS
jgi:hypothetical protein